MTSRDLSRTDKPLAPIGNILNSARLPVYRTLRKSSRKMSSSSDAKLHLYDFENDGIAENGKRFKKSQKVRKRARIYVRHNKENAKICKTGLNDNHIEKYRKTVPTENSFVKIGIKNNVLQEIQVQADVHHNGFSPVDDDIVSVTSEVCDNLSEYEEDFLGFPDQECVHHPNALQLNGFKTPEKNFCKTPLRPIQTPNPYNTPIKNNLRSSLIPVIEFNESFNRNQLQPNHSIENINPNDTFHSMTFGAADKYFSTPVKDNSFNSTCLSDLSTSDFNVTNCFGFEEPDRLNEEFLISPIKLHMKRAEIKIPNVHQGPNRPQLPSVKDIIDRLKGEVDEISQPSSGELFAPEIEISILKSNQITPYLNSSSVDYLTKELVSEIEVDEPKIHNASEVPNDHIGVNKKHMRRSYERPVYLRNRKDSHHEDTDEEDHNKQKEIEKTKVKKNQKNTKKKVGPTKKEVDELEKWAQAFNSQCAQVEAFNLCVE